jgi:hypothetical protein
MDRRIKFDDDKEKVKAQGFQLLGVIVELDSTIHVLPVEHAISLDAATISSPVQSLRGTAPTTWTTRCTGPTCYTANPD